jgi:carboxylate-amine ligase
VGALLDHISPALAELGDAERVTAGVHRLLDLGTGADRQRRAVADGGLSALLDLIAPGPAAHPAASDVPEGAERR